MTHGTEMSSRTAFLEVVAKGSSKKVDWVDLRLPTVAHRVTTSGWHMLFLLNDKSPSKMAEWISLKKPEPFVRWFIGANFKKTSRKLGSQPSADLNVQFVQGVRECISKDVGLLRGWYGFDLGMALDYGSENFNKPNLEVRSLVCSQRPETVV